MKKYNAVIFDLDGVICHTDKYHYEAWKKVADEIGIYFDQEINNRLRGVSRMESFEIILERYNGELNESEKEFWITKKNDIYKELLKNMNTSDLSEEVKATLDGLRAANHKLAIGSSSKNARFILGQLGLGEYFDAISDGNNISKSKPDPEVFSKEWNTLAMLPDFLLICAVRIQLCTLFVLGPSASMPDSLPPKNQMHFIAVIWLPVRKVCQWHSTWLLTAVMTPITNV